jgi:hypothetical protein
MSIEQAPHDLNWATHHLIYHSGCGDDFIMYLFYFILLILLCFFLFNFFFLGFVHLPFCSFPPPQEDYADPCPKLGDTFVGRSSFLGNLELAWKGRVYVCFGLAVLKNQRTDSHP